MKKTFKLYKLIVLYMLSRVDFPLTNSQVSDFILNAGYTNYFTLQQTISELAESGLIHEESTYNRTFLHLTEEGEKTIHFFMHEIHRDIRGEIDAFFKRKKYELKNEVSVKSDYCQNSSREYTVTCQVLERDIPLIDLKVTVPTENEAQVAASNWSQKNQEIYAMIMANLL